MESETTDDDDNNLGGGAIAGIVAGAIFFIAIIAIPMVCCCFCSYGCIEACRGADERHERPYYPPPPRQIGAAYPGRAYYIDTAMYDNDVYAPARHPRPYELQHPSRHWR